MTLQDRQRKQQGKGILKIFIPSQEHWQVLERAQADLFEPKVERCSPIKKSREEGEQNTLGRCSIDLRLARCLIENQPTNLYRSMETGQVKQRSGEPSSI